MSRVGWRAIEHDRGRAGPRAGNPPETNVLLRGGLVAGRSALASRFDRTDAIACGRRGLDQPPPRRGRPALRAMRILRGGERPATEGLAEQPASPAHAMALAHGLGSVD